MRHSKIRAFCIAAFAISLFNATVVTTRAVMETLIAILAAVCSASREIKLCC